MDTKTQLLIDKINNNILNITNSNSKEISNLKEAILENNDYNIELEKTIEKFLSPLVSAYNFNYDHPYWFDENTTYNDNIWHIKLLKNKQTIDFNKIIICDKYKLTDNHNILKLFKDWIVYSGSPKYFTGNSPSNITINRTLRQVYILIDSIILNSKKINLVERKITALDKYFFSDILVRIGKHGCEEGVYQYSKTVEIFLKKQIQNMDISDYDEFIINFPYIEPSNTNPYLTLSEDEINLCRYWLYNNNAYKKHPKRKGISIQTNFFDFLYSNCLSISYIKFPIIEEFNLIHDGNDGKEYRAIPVRNDDKEALGHKTIISYLNRISLLGQIINKYNNFKSDIHELNLKSIEDQVQLKPIGRFVTLPTYIVFDSIKYAYNFLFEYMDDILYSIKSIYLHLKCKDKKYIREFKTLSIESFLTEKLKSIGVTKWYIPLSDKNRFTKIRSNIGLFNLFDILLGCIQILIGSTMARRQSEIITMKSIGCLIPKNIDPEQHEDIDFEVIFENQKSGFSLQHKYRELLSKPILRSLANFIYKLQNFNNFLIDNSFCSKDVSLLISIDQRSLKVSNSNSVKYNENLNCFCDYFSLRIIEYKKNDFRRFYIRQHQLRRFFAILFFWSKSFEGLDSLRNFLGHTDSEHLYHYITENITGEILTGVKAKTIINQIQNLSLKNHIENIENIFPILMDIFSVKEFQLLTEHQVYDQFNNENSVLYLNDIIKAEEKISNLIDKNIIDLKPDFFTTYTESGEKIRDFKLILYVNGDSNV